MLEGCLLSLATALLAKNLEPLALGMTGNLVTPKMRVAKTIESSLELPKHLMMCFLHVGYVRHLSPHASIVTCDMPM
jgi:hypothetical protein